MKQSPLPRRLLAGAVGILMGAAGAIAVAAPAHAQEGSEAVTARTPIKSLNVEGSALCDEETGETTVTWTVTNTSSINIGAAITNVVADGEIEGDIEVGTPLGQGESATSTQLIDEGIESVSLEVELTWTWSQWAWVWVPANYFWQRPKLQLQLVEKTKSKTASAFVEIGDCDAPPPPPPPDPIIPAIIVVVTCDTLAVIVDNAESDAETGITLIPNETVSHGPASGFTYFFDEEDNLVVDVADDAGVDVVGEADADNPVALGPFAPGADVYTHGFEAFAGLVVTLEMTLNGEAFEFEEGDNVISWDEDVAFLDCETGGEGGELPVTGMSTGLMALGAVALLALGGGLFMVARRRRVTFTAA